MESKRPQEYSRVDRLLGRDLPKWAALLNLCYLLAIPLGYVLILVSNNGSSNIELLYLWCITILGLLVNRLVISPNRREYKNQEVD